MVLCKFYQQGRCRFGDECRFEHTDSSSSYYGQGSTYAQEGDRYHYVKSQQTNRDVASSNEPKPIGQVLEVVNQDMIAADKGGQWPFSAYAPVKEYGCIVGLDDISPEELRWQMYMAMQSGTIDECKRQFQDLLQSAVMKRNLLMSQSPDAYTIVQTIYHSKDPTTSTIQNQSDFQFAPGIFGGSSPSPSTYSTNIFGGPTVASPNAFTGQTSNVFGGSTTPNQPPSGLFGAAAAAVTNQSTSLFGAPPSQPPSGLFGAAAASLQSSPGLFGAAPTQSPSLFGASPASNSGSMFGSSAPPSGLFSAAAASLQSSPSLFGSAPAQAPSVFGGTSALQSPNVFGGSSTVQSPSIFGATGAEHSPSVFGSSAPQPSNVFGAPNASASIFGQSPAVDNTAQQPSFFQKSTASVPTFNSENISNSKDGTLYTPISQLSEDDLAAFKAKTFTMGQVPIRPPPKELCC